MLRRYVKMSFTRMLLLNLFISVSILPLFSGELNFSATVDRTTVGLGETFTLNVTVSGENIGNVPNPKLPDMPDFNILGRSSSQSTSISFINGKMSQQMTINFIYTISPKKIGKFTIAPCKIDYQGKTYETQPIEIEVIKGTTQAPPASPPSQPRVSTPDAGDNNIFILAIPSRTQALCGEQINVSFYLYTRYSIGNLEFAKLPGFSGFWAEVTKEVRQLRFQTKEFNGKTYNVALLRTYAIFPLTNGTLKIDPIELNVEVIQPPRDFFDFFGSSRIVKIESKPISINVSPLPEENKPENFCGGVGKFRVSASLDRDSILGGAPINLILKISGTGNIRLIEKPKIGNVPNLKILEPEVKDNIQVSGDYIQGTKEFRFPVIAQVDGEHVIPEIKIAYYDPQKKVYETITTPKLKFIAMGTTAVSTAPEEGGLKILGSDIQYIKPDAQRFVMQTWFTPRWIFALYIFSILIIFGAFFYQRHQARLLIDYAYARRRRAGNLFQKRIKQLEALLKKDNPKDFYTGLVQAIMNYLGDRYNLSVGTLTKEQLKQELANKGVAKDLLEQLFQIIEYCENAGYAPTLAKSGEPMEIFKNAKRLMGKL
ncbi:MAG: BatD family protein [bacterium]